MWEDWWNFSSFCSAHSSSYMVAQKSSGCRDSSLLFSLRVLFWRGGEERGLGWPTLHFPLFFTLFGKCLKRPWLFTYITDCVHIINIGTQTEDQVRSTVIRDEQQSWNQTWLPDRTVTRLSPRQSRFFLLLITLRQTWNLNINQPLGEEAGSAAET